VKALRLLGSLGFVLGLFTVIFAGIPWHVMVVDDPTVPLWLQAAVFCLLGGVLLVLLTVALEQQIVKKADAGLDAPEGGGEILVVSSLDVPGRTVTEVLGLAQGHTVFAIWLGKDLSALVRLVVGGELTEYTDMMGRARETANRRMIVWVSQMGADAIINVRYMTTSVVGSAAELLAYGTAVKLAARVSDEDEQPLQEARMPQSS